MKNNTKLIMETWRRFLKEGTEGIGEDGIVIEVSEDDPSSLPAVADTDLEGDIKTIDSTRKQNNQPFDDEYNPAGDMGDMDNMGEFNPYDSSPIPPEGLHSDDDGLVPAGEDSIGPYFTDDEEYETNGSSDDPVSFDDSLDMP